MHLEVIVLAIIEFNYVRKARKEYLSFNLEFLEFYFELIYLKYTRVLMSLCV